MRDLVCHFKSCNMNAIAIILITIITVIVIIVGLIIGFTPSKHYSNNYDNSNKVEIKSNFRIELENNLSKYRKFTFELSKNKTYPIELRNFDSIKFVDERNLIIFHVYGDKYLDIEYNSNEDYLYEKNRMLNQYEKYKQSLEDLYKYYPPHEEQNEDYGWDHCDDCY